MDGPRGIVSELVLDGCENKPRTMGINRVSRLRSLQYNKVMYCISLPAFHGCPVVSQSNLSRFTPTSYSGCWHTYMAPSATRERGHREVRRSLRRRPPSPRGPDRVMEAFSRLPGWGGAGSVGRPEERDFLFLAGRRRGREARGVLVTLLCAILVKHY